MWIITDRRRTSIEYVDYGDEFSGSIDSGAILHSIDADQGVFRKVDTGQQFV